MKKPALRAGAEWIGLVVGVASVGATALEGLKHQIAHRPDVSLDAFVPIGIVVAILGPLAIGAVTFRFKFPVEPGQHRIVRKSNARDRGQQSDGAADQCRDGGSKAMIAEGRANLLQDRCVLIHGIVLQ